MIPTLFRRVVLLVFAVLLLLVAAPAAGATSDHGLLATYQPVLRVDASEMFLPTSVQSFVSDAVLEQMIAPNQWVVVDPDPEPGSLPGPGTGTWRLNQEPYSPSMTLGGLSSYAAAWNEGHGAPVMYGRVVRQDDAIVLQYWLFYYDDVYSYFYAPTDFLWQAHEGDWEVVNVVLSADEQPSFVGYSQHCLGERRDWAATDRVDGTHPVVYVATGSHANLFASGAHQIDLRCVPPQVQAILGALHLPPASDHWVFPGAVVGPPGAGGRVSPIVMLDGLPWTAFPGTWGEAQYFHVGSPLNITAALGTSPPGPAYHEVWTSPLATLATWTQTP